MMTIYRENVDPTYICTHLRKSHYVCYLPEGGDGVGEGGNGAWEVGEWVEGEVERR